jgi:hypothetical protein
MNNNTSKHTPTRVGKYLISPLIKAVDGGWFACSVSVRSGSESATSDRVLRLTRLFRTPLAAAEYAKSEGLRWIGQPRAVPA